MTFVPFVAMNCRAAPASERAGETATPAGVSGRRRDARSQWMIRLTNCDQALGPKGPLYLILKKYWLTESSFGMTILAQLV